MHNKQITQYWTVCLHSKEKKGCPFNRCIQEAGSAHGTNKGGSEGLVGDISTQHRALTGDCFCNVRLFDANKMASFWRSNIETSSARSGCAMLRVHTWWFSQPLQRATQKSKGQRAAACLVRFVLPTLPFCSRKRPLNCYCVDATSCGKCPQGNTVSRKRFFSPLSLPGCFSFFMLLLSRTNPMFLNVSSGLENELWLGVSQPIPN